MKTKWCRHMKYVFHKDNYFGTTEWFYRVWDGVKFHTASDSWKLCPICGAKRPTKGAKR